MDFGCCRGGVQFGQFLGREMHRAGADIVQQMRQLGRAWDWHHPRFLRHQPAKRDLSGSGGFSLGPLLDDIDKRHVVREIFGLKAWHDRPDVAFLEARIGVDHSRQKAHAERAPRHKTVTSPLETGNNSYRFRASTAATKTRRNKQTISA